MSERGGQPSDDYRLWVNADRTVLMRIWDQDIGDVALRGSIEISLRDHPAATWGPPIPMIREAP